MNTTICDQKPLVIDGDKLLKDLRLPYWTISLLREMRVGDSYELFDVYGPPLGIQDDEPSNAGARIDRIKGGFVLSALWMLHVGKAKKRGHMLCLDTKLILLPKRQFAVCNAIPNSETPVDMSGLRLFVRVVRLAHRLSDMAKAAGAKDDARMLRPSMLKNTADRCGYRVPFLDSIAAEKLSTHGGQMTHFLQIGD